MIRHCGSQLTVGGGGFRDGEDSWMQRFVDDDNDDDDGDEEEKHKVKKKKKEKLLFYHLKWW